jgi:hypothetical protein
VRQQQGGDHIRAIHRLLILDADREDVAGGHDLEVHLVVRPHHAEGLPDAKMEGTSHVLGDMPHEGA